MSATNPQTITFEFSGPVFNVMIQAGGIFPLPRPTVPLTATAYNGETEVASGPFDDGCNEREIDEFHVPATSFITRLVITPPQPMPSAGVQFYIHYAVPCPPTGDPVPNDPDVRQALLDALNASNPNSTDPAQRKEHGGIIWELPNGGGFMATPIIDPLAEACAYDWRNGPQGTNLTPPCPRGRPSRRLPLASKPLVCPS
jgi:hypothetical protein